MNVLSSVVESFLPLRVKLPEVSDIAPLFQVSPSSIVAVPPATANSAASLIVTTASLPITEEPVTFNLVEFEPSALPKFKAPFVMLSPVVIVNSSRMFVVEDTVF